MAAHRCTCSRSVGKAPRIEIKHRLFTTTTESKPQFRMRQIEFGQRSGTACQTLWLKTLHMIKRHGRNQIQQ